MRQDDGMVFLRCYVYSNSQQLQFGLCMGVWAACYRG
jgi:hypothetical protein